MKIRDFVSTSLFRTTLKKKTKRQKNPLLKSKRL